MSGRLVVYLGRQGFSYTKWAVDSAGIVTTRELWSLWCDGKVKLRTGSSGLSSLRVSQWSTGVWAGWNVGMSGLFRGIS